MGEKDLLESIMVHKLGAHVHFGRIHMKPGKPTTLFTWVEPLSKRTKMLFALPGNPVSSSVCFHLLVRPALEILHSCVPYTSVEEIVSNAIVQTEVEAILTQDIKLDVERPEYHRVTLAWCYKKHCFLATSTGVQRSSRFMSLQNADGVLVLPQAVKGKLETVHKGERQLCLLLKEKPFQSAGLKWKNCHHRTFFDTPYHRHVNRHVNHREHNSHQHPSIHHQDHYTSHGHSHRNESHTSIVATVIGIHLPTTHTHVAKDVGNMLRTTLALDETKALQDVYLTKSLEQVEALLRDAKPNLVVIVSDGGYESNLDLSCRIDAILEKRAEAVAMQARIAMAAHSRICALFEVVVGWYQGKLVVCLPFEGFETGLKSILDLVRHAVSVGSSP